VRRAVSTALLGLAVILAACGDDGNSPPDAAPADQSPQVAAAYQDVEDALAQSEAPLCPGPGEFRPAPATDGSTASAPHFRYTDGRIYELGPCELPADQRGELRVYRYEDPALRDDAAVSSLDRNPRPTFMWTSGDRLLIEEWVFNPAETDPAFDEVAGTVHDAVSALPETEGVS
jgi:predicted small lipoprotein YifL